jgi:hypothetical protein
VINDRSPRFLKRVCDNEKKEEINVEESSELENIKIQKFLDPTEQIQEEATTESQINLVNECAVSLDGNTLIEKRIDKQESTTNNIIK